MNQKGLLYSKMKVFHYKNKIDSLPADNIKISPPLHIRIKPTNLCNHNCSYCAYRANNLQLGKDMGRQDFIPRDKILEIIDDLSKMGVKAVTFSGGGEPLCYPYILDAAKRLMKTRIKFATLTNGSLLYGEIAEIFAHKATWVRISLDGWNDKSYSLYRRVRNGEFTRVISNIINFKKFGGTCYIGVSIIVDKKNASHLFSLIQLLKNSGVNSIKVSPCVVSDDVKASNKYHQVIFETVKEQINKAISKLADVNFEICDAYHELEEKFLKKYTWCPYMQILPVIGADLNIYACQDKAYNLKEGLIGSIKKERFEDFWFSDKSRFFKLDPSKDCVHHCVSNEKNKLIIEYLMADRRHLEFA